MTIDSVDDIYKAKVCHQIATQYQHDAVDHSLKNPKESLKDAENKCLLLIKKC